MSIMRGGIMRGGIMRGGVLRDGIMRSQQAMIDMILTGPSLDGRIAFSRNSIGTRFNQAGLLVTEAADVARFDYDPVTHAALGLLVEPQRTNLFLWSEGFDNAAWTTASGGGPPLPTITANTIAAPDGATSADTIALPDVSAANAYSLAYQYNILPATLHSMSVFLRGAAGTESMWIMRTPDGTTYESTLAALTTSWQRFSVVDTAIPGAVYSQIGVDLRDTAQAARTAQSLYAWGAQLEQGSFATSYIPTTTAAVTRVADSPQITLSQPADILVQDSEGGQWISGVAAGLYTLAPRTNKRHITRWRAYPVGNAVNRPDLAVAYP